MDNSDLKWSTFRELIQAQLSGEVLQLNVLGDVWTDFTSTLPAVSTEDIDKVVKGVRIKPKTRYCNGVELDECIKEPLENGDIYHIANPLGNGYSSVLFWYGGDNDFKYKIRGIAYLKEESAVKHAKAMLNIS